MSSEKIRTELGWLNGFDAPSFQPFRHAEIARLNYTAWSHPSEFIALDLSNPNPPPNFISQRAKWVQLVGIASLVSSLFTQTEGPLPEGILLADEVGVGKTLHALGFIAFINQIIQGRTAGIVDPPILSLVLQVLSHFLLFLIIPIEDNPFFAGVRDIPEQPHLIVVPHGLVLQWQQEAQTWFKKGAIDIFPYTGTVQSHRFFWGKDGPYQNSEFFKSGKLSRIIIIASQNVCNFGKCP
ncbi:hypothetical protein BS47DRAFT_1295599 [Hydnum rufescens UP504]|uniref:SNF2 N-terminal domain-containing protein n=1 Tax=Hydnum rufescens UP504 TaxID=1448309 RepID=A0A9P6AXR6_9AGAM|nr:hypothetical protein BS47DRAFT_1295599 [Hydnum rufescens UP504]